MSPAEMAAYRLDFDAACRRLGWTTTGVHVPHEREYDRGCDEDVWVTPDGRRLFAEHDLTPALVEELIRIAGGR